MIGTLVLPEPDEAVTVTFDVPAGVPLAGGVPLELSAGGGDEESLLLQLNIPTIASMTKQPEAMLRRRLSDP